MSRGSLLWKSSISACSGLYEVDGVVLLRLVDPGIRGGLRFWPGGVDRSIRLMLGSEFRSWVPGSKSS